MSDFKKKCNNVPEGSDSCFHFKPTWTGCRSWDNVPHAFFFFSNSVDGGSFFVYLGFFSCLWSDQHKLPYYNKEKHKIGTILANSYFFSCTVEGSPQHILHFHLNPPAAHSSVTPIFEYPSSLHPCTFFMWFFSSPFPWQLHIQHLFTNISTNLPPQMFKPCLPCFSDFVSEAVNLSCTPDVLGYSSGKYIYFSWFYFLNYQTFGIIWKENNHRRQWDSQEIGQNHFSLQNLYFKD